MGFRLNKTDYSLSTHQGDSGKIKVKNIPTDKDYKVCLAFQDKRRNFLDKLFMQSEKQSEVIFCVEEKTTNKFTVAPTVPCEIYYWGIVLIDNETGAKNTPKIGTVKFGELNKLIVFPKKA